MAPFSSQPSQNTINQASNTENQIQTKAVSTSTADRVFGISEFGMAKEGSFYRVWFQLTDQNLVPLAADAKVHLKVATIKMDYNFETQQYEETPTVFYERLYA